MKFPSQRKLQYQTGALSNDAWTQITSGGVSGYLNLPKDLSLLNRRGYASTTRDGTPLVFRCKIDMYIQDEDGFGLGAAVGSDFMTTLKIDGCQNNWVMKNGSKKFHAARNAMWKKAGVRKSSLGAYAHEMRLNFAGASDTWLVPIDGAGDAFTGGTWDATELVTESDSSGFFLKITGSGIDETAGNTATAINIGHSYMSSRSHVAADSNLESSESPTKFSILNELLRPVATSAVDDNIIEDAQAQGDNPPYEIDIDDPNCDITEPVELGRAVAGLGNAYGSVIVDIPFGLAQLRATHYDAADTNITTGGLVCVEVLDIYEMEG